MLHWGLTRPGACMPRSLPLAALLLGACGQPELNPDAYHWDVVLSGFEDTCNEPAEPYRESMTYSLSFDGSAASVALGWETFANGSISGCNLEYESPLIGEDRPGGFVQWVLTGEAAMRSGGDGCDMGEQVDEFINGANLSWDDYSDGKDADAVDWIGIETFEIAYSEDPALVAGCTYSLLVVGAYQQNG